MLTATLSVKIQNQIPCLCSTSCSDGNRMCSQRLSAAASLDREMCFPKPAAWNFFLSLQNNPPEDNMTEKVQKQLQKDVLTVSVQRIGQCRWLIFVYIYICVCNSILLHHIFSIKS